MIALTYVLENHQKPQLWRIIRFLCCDLFKTHLSLNFSFIPRLDHNSYGGFFVNWNHARQFVTNLPIGSKQQSSRDQGLFLPPPSFQLPISLSISLSPTTTTTSPQIVKYSVFWLEISLCTTHIAQFREIIMLTRGGTCAVVSPAGDAAAHPAH